MNKKITVGTTVILMLFAIFLTFQITYSFVEKEYQAKVDLLTKTQSDFPLLAQADVLVRENYYSSVDRGALESGLVSAYLSLLPDSYSRYLTAEEYEQYKKEQAGVESGVGIRLTYDSSSRKIIVYEVFPDSPAETSGIQKGDELYKVGGELVSALGFYDTTAALSGEAGTTVSVTVKREIAARKLEMDFTMTRREIRASSISFQMLPDDIGYIQIFSFDPSTPEDFSKAITAILDAQAQGVVFDVRNTTGENLEAVCAMLDELLPQGVLLRTFDHNGKEGVIESHDGDVILPMAVLMNSATSGSAEIFAAVLRDFEKATLVGEKTFGKGVSQAVLELDDGSAMILSNMTFSPPQSDSFEKVGVKPDIDCKLKGQNVYLLDHENDNQLQEAIRTLFW